MAKIIDTLKIDDYEIETEDGWKDLTHIHKTIPYQKWIVKTKDYVLECADEHIIFDKHFNHVYVRDAKVGLKIHTRKGLQQITHVEQTAVVESMYDVTVKHNKHSFYSNGILSHNSVVTRIILLHFVLFNTDKTAAILANKEKTAHKLMKEFKDAYMLLPIWLQQGVVEGGWNKGEVNFGNGMRVIASSTSSNSVRSESIALLLMDEFAFVPDNIASEFFSSVYPTISSGKKSKVIIVSCVPKNTLLLTDKGPQSIGSMIPDVPGIFENQPYTVYGYDQPHKGTIVVNNGEQQTKHITTAVVDVESTLIHKWLCSRADKTTLIPAKDLQVGDFLAIRCGTDVWGNNNTLNFNQFSKFPQHSLNVATITSDWAYFFGLFIVKGSTQQHSTAGDVIDGTVIITCGDHLEVCSLLNKLKLNYKCSDKLRHSIHSKELLNLLQLVGFDLNLKSSQKIIPDRLLQMSRDNIISMLQGIFDGGGYSTKFQGRVGINLSSEKLLRQIKILLLNLGICGTCNFRVTKSTHLVKPRLNSCRLQLTGQQAVKFYECIGFRFERKQNNVCFVNKNCSRNSSNIIPFSKLKLLALKELDIDAYKQVQQTGIFKGNYHKSNHFNYQTIQKFASQLQLIDHPVVQDVLEMSRSDVVWQPIIKIEDSRNVVYDLSLPDIDSDPWCHSVLYNQVIGTQTPNGMNHFYRMWQRAVRGDSGYYPIKINWWEPDNRDEEFKQETIANLQGGVVEWNQEFGCILGDKSYVLIEEQKTGKKRKITIENLYNELLNDSSQRTHQM